MSAGGAEGAVSLDPGLLRSLMRDEAGGARGLVAELVGIFRADVAARIESLARACEAGDDEGVRRHAHAIKGSSGTIGAMRLSALAESAERAGVRAGAAGALEIREEFARACGLIDELVGGALRGG